MKEDGATDDEEDFSTSLMEVRCNLITEDCENLERDDMAKKYRIVGGGSHFLFRRHCS